MGKKGKPPRRADEDTHPVSGRPEILNGFEIPDWLVEPIVRTAVSGLSFGREAFDKSELPPTLVGLLGRRADKVKEHDLDAVARALGRHERFTERVLTVFFTVHGELVGRCARRRLPTLQREIDDGALYPEEAVSALIACDRLDQARKLALWVQEQEDAADDDGVLEIVTTIARTNRETAEELELTQRDLATERRRTKRLTKQLDKAMRAAREAVRDAAGARRAAAEANASTEQVARRVHTLEQELVTHRKQVEDGRRVERDLRAEITEVQARLQRVRRALRETRALLPKEPEPLTAIPRPAERPPRLGELRALLHTGGARAVLDRKDIRVVVDGYNVCLRNGGEGRLEDKRRLLEQALQTYQSRTGNRTLVVYDGRKVDWFPPPMSRRTFERAFTVEGELADDYIVEELEVARNGSTPVVITSDHDLRQRCIALGAFALHGGDAADVLGLSQFR